MQRTWQEAVGARQLVHVVLVPVAQREGVYLGRSAAALWSPEGQQASVQLHACSSVPAVRGKLGCAPGKKQWAPVSSCTSSWSQWLSESVCISAALANSLLARCHDTKASPSCLASGLLFFLRTAAWQWDFAAQRELAWLWLQRGQELNAAANSLLARCQAASASPSCVALARSSSCAQHLGNETLQHSCVDCC